MHLIRFLVLDTNNGAHSKCTFGGLGTLADLLRPRELRTLAILLRPRTDDLFARSRPGTPKKVMGPPEEGTLADLLAPEGQRRTLAVLLRI